MNENNENDENNENNEIKPLEWYDKDYNIIGIYKLTKTKIETTKEAPWAHLLYHKTLETSSSETSLETPSPILTSDSENMENDIFTNLENNTDSNTYGYRYGYDNNNENVDNENSNENNNENSNENSDDNSDDNSEFKIYRNYHYRNFNNYNNRDNGFSILSNREHVIQHLKKTKFCQIMIDKGECKRSICNFAHSVNEIVFPDCAFGEKCKKQYKCMFKHPHENEDSYKCRIRFTVPPHIY